MKLLERSLFLIISLYFLFRGIVVGFFDWPYDPQHIAVLTYLIAGIVILTPWKKD